MKNYQAAQFEGTTWGLFHVETRNWCMFGSEKRIKERAASLNQQEMMERELRYLNRGIEELTT
jgi:hypothetical protein